MSVTYAAVPMTTDEAVELLDAAATDHILGLAVTRLGQPADSAATLVLVHGVGSRRSAWATMVPELATRYHLIVLDLPGHGLSDPLAAAARADCASLAGHVIRACIELETANPIVVGNSLGGWIGLEMAAAGAAAGLVALAPAGLRSRPLPPGPLLLGSRAAARRLGWMVDPLLSNPVARRVALSSVCVRPQDLTPTLARSSVDGVARCTSYERILESACHRRFERAGQVEAPTTIVFGDRDLILPGGAQAHTLAPAHARWVRLDRCGHVPMWDAPRASISVIDDLVGQVAGRTVDGG